MIVSLNIPDDLIAFIDGKATHAKLSRSAWMTAFLRNSQALDSHTGKQALQACILNVMAHGALRSGAPLERVRSCFPDFDRPLALDESPTAPPPPSPQLPAAADAPACPPPPSESVTATRRRPYQRGGTHR